MEVCGKESESGGKSVVDVCGKESGSGGEIVLGVCDTGNMHSLETPT